MTYIELRGSPNVRDLGGMTTEDGRVVKTRRLIRAGRLDHLTNADVSVLMGRFRMRTIVDFRSQMERESLPDPHWGIIEHHDLSVLEDTAYGFPKEDQLTEAKMIDRLMRLMEDPAFSPRQFMLDVYRMYIAEPQSQQAWRRFLQLLIAQREGAVLFHCNGGKDRTGLGAAFILTSLGVPWQTVLEDYLQSNEYLREPMNQMLNELPVPYRVPAGRRAAGLMYQVEADYLQSAKDEMIRLAGSPLGYVQQVLGLTEADIKQLQQIYLN